jgi:hypothetical protein
MVRDEAFWLRAAAGPLATECGQASGGPPLAGGGAAAAKIDVLRFECDTGESGPTAKEAEARQLRDEVDPSKLPFLLPKSEKHSQQVKRRPEELAELRNKPMPEAFTVPVTKHVPIPHFLTEQLKRAAELGLVEMRMDQQGQWRATNGTDTVVEHGPTPYLDFDADDYTGPPPPANTSDMFVDPATWDRVVDWYRRYCLEIERAELGYTFNVNNVPGGQSGIRIETTEVKPEWRRLVWKLPGVRGQTPTVVRPSIPDSNSTVRLFEVYRDAMAAGIADKEIVSMLALFGVQAKCTMSLATVLIPNYKMAWQQLGEIQKAYVKKRMEYDPPRASAERPWPHHWPSRLLPKGCVRQEKDDGRVKFRETTDAGALREAMERMREYKHETSRLHIDNMIEKIENLKKKAPPGTDSPNGTMDIDIVPDFLWGSVDKFGEQVDILVSAGVPVECTMYDFSAYYLLFPRAAEEQWFCEETVSSAGPHVAHRCQFGFRELPHLLNRFAYVVLQLIERKLQYEQAVFPIDQVPASVQQWMADRAEQGLSINWWAAMGFFDDSSLASFEFFADTVRRVATNMWAQYNMTIEESKTHVLKWGAPVTEAILGVIIDPANRERRLSPAKVAKYTANIDAIVALADSTRKRLVPKTDMQQILGRCIFAMQAGLPALRGDIQVLLSRLSGRWSRQFLCLGREAADMLRHIRWRLLHENGCALTPYRARPGEDGAVVLVSYTDAGLKGEWPVVTEAGFGGFVFEQYSNKIFYFHGKWDPQKVQDAHLDINDLESACATYSAEVADEVLVRLGKADQQHYLYSIGDSSVFFAHVADRGRASSPGLRYIYRERTEADSKRTLRTNCFLHVTRGWNRAADKLAGGQLTDFFREARWLLGESVTFEQVQPASTSIDGLCAFVSACRQQVQPDRRRVGGGGGDATHATRRLRRTDGDRDDGVLRQSRRAPRERSHRAGDEDARKRRR